MLPSVSAPRNSVARGFSESWTASAKCDNSGAMSRFLILAVAASIGAFAQIPAQDSRNTNTPNTDTHFTPRTYKTLAEWENRRQFEAGQQAVLQTTIDITSIEEPA